MNILICIHCGTELGPVSLDKQVLDGRLVCLKCRRAEASGLNSSLAEDSGSQGWLSILALMAICALFWAVIYFL